MFQRWIYVASNKKQPLTATTTDLGNSLMGKWFCIWQFSDNRKINLNLEPKPAVVPERQPSVWWSVRKKVNKKTIYEIFNYPIIYFMW